MSPVLERRLVAIAAAVLVDRLTPEPPNRWHPVAWFGTAMTAIERRLWRDRRPPGVVYAATGLGIGVAAGRLLRSPTIALTVALGAGSLRATAATIGDLVAADDLAAARLALPGLVGRDPSGLDGSGIAAAVVESVAENSVDATVAPIVWTLVAGAPGALGYRATNTMDAMVGHRSARHERFGWASARLDDIANWVPARVFAAAVTAAAWHRRSAIARAVRADAPAHPSPNAGVAEAAVAGALGVELGGTLRYGDRVERRPRLGRGPRPDATTVESANELVDRSLVVLAVAGLGVVVGGRLLGLRSAVSAGHRR